MSKKLPIFVGIDPGKKGAIAILQGKAIRTYYTPVVTTRRKLRTKTKSGKPKVEVTTRYSARMMLLILRSLARKRGEGYQVLVAIERASIRPTDSKSVVASVADGFAVWRTLLDIVGLPPKIVTPSTWKPRYVETGSVKEVSQRACQKLYPTLPLKLKKSEALAEAVLIADYLRRKTQGLAFPAITMMTPEERVRSERIAATEDRGRRSFEAKVASRTGKSRRRVSRVVKATCR